jgi:transcriptional regulator with XRE-family HTH domain
MSKLKQYLKRHGIKQSWLVEQLGMTPAWVNRLVNDKSTPNVYDAQRIARLLNTTVEELWPLEEYLEGDTE